ncbi:peroxiredoxin [Comamonas sp. JC664]|uniref:peroxiredoxin n=1 Tax=Comamonas sp. JC664 TaxID=2801917 RepID=UPI00174BC440|nr:peroxiredoxin [Comamonas sp. JC664]MBL0699151.1 peroxiredoxin [Comamonas sp. JC664]
MLVPLIVAGLFSGAIPQAGETAPDFTAKDSTGKVHTLSELVKQGPVILAFFPKAFTGGCTKELKAYRDRYADVQKAQGQVLAISMDDAETLARFKADLNAPFAFIPDPEGHIVTAYDVKMPMVSVPKRYTFVVGEDRKILKVESGSDAIDPNGAIVACPLRKPTGAKPADAKPAEPQAPATK